MTGHLEIDDAWIKNSIDDVNLVQRLRREIGNDRRTIVTINVSAWALDQLLGMGETALRHRKGELE